MKTTLAFLATVTALAGAEPVRFRRSTGHPPLLALFTSGGCRSCPPTDSWVARLQPRGERWKGFVPVGFRGDSWNGPGWPDRFSLREISRCQRADAAEWGTSTVYPPGFVLAGAEWRAWSRRSSVPAGSRRTVAGIEVKLRDHGTAEVTCSPAENSPHSKTPPRQIPGTNETT